MTIKINNDNDKDELDNLKDVENPEDNDITQQEEEIEDSYIPEDPEEEVFKDFDFGEEPLVVDDSDKAEE